jgi:hypothetical protein
MRYLLARCPMYGCNQKNLISTLRSDGMPEFEPHVYVIVRCTHCGQEFRELASRMEVSQENPSKSKTG